MLDTEQINELWRHVHTENHTMEPVSFWIRLIDRLHGKHIIPINMSFFMSMQLKLATSENNIQTL